MNIIVIDDDKPALRVAEKAVKAVVAKDDVRAFLSPNDALRYAAETTPDAAFLAIGMREMDGLSLSKKLKRLNGKINLIFVTNYEQYAEDAWRVHASGFIKKPVTREDIRHELDNLRYPVQTNGF